jgi:aminoglycoside phosphotransferase (APT) family kinase protein
VAPDPLTQRPPERALAWAAQGGRLVSVRVLRGGSAHANHALAVVDRTGRRREVVLRRWARPGWRLTDADYDARREIEALRLLERARLPAPRLLAADPDGHECDVPALLVTLLPGDPPRGLPPVGELAAVLPALHAVGGAEGAIPSYRPYVRIDESPPFVAGRPVWARAFELLREPAPPAPACLIHRDYHPGNTLWSGGRLTGVVDWTYASFGPPQVDVGHMRWNLAVDHGSEAAEEFLAAWRRSSGGGVDYDPYWDVRTAVDVLHEEPERRLLDRLEGHVAAALG